MATVNSIDQLLKLGNKYFCEDENIFDIKLAIFYFKKAASLGSLEALLELALIYDYDGQKELSKKCFEKLVETRYVPAIYKIITGEVDYELAENIDWDKFVWDWYEEYRELQDGEKIYEYAKLKIRSWDKSYGYELLQQAASYDHSNACYDLGRSHLYLEIKEPSLDQALHWLTKSVNLGNRFSCRELGDLYLLGRGYSTTISSQQSSFEVTPDHAKALDFYKKSILMGWFSVAENRLYSYFKKGFFLQGNFSEVERWLLYSAEKNDKKSMRILGLEYASGELVEKNGHLAIYWLRRAAQYDDVDACLKLAEIYINEDFFTRDFDEAIFWFCKATSYNEKQIGIDSTFKILKNFAINFFEVQCLESVVSEMFRNLELELSVSDIRSLGDIAYKLGLHHELGLGTPVDLINAGRFYELATLNGNKRAKLHLEKLIF
jgi:TPR repeat protein